MQLESEGRGSQSQIGWYKVCVHKGVSIAATWPVMIWHHCQEQMVDSHATGQGRNNSDRKNKAERMGLRDRSKGTRHTQGQARALGGGVCPALFENFTFKNDFATFTYDSMFIVCIRVYACEHALKTQV